MDSAAVVDMVAEEQARLVSVFQQIPVAVERPGIEVPGVSLPSGVPGIGPGLPPFLDVPSDGLCLYHCMAVAQDPEQWLAKHSTTGVPCDAQTAAEDTYHAQCLRNSISERANALGDSDLAERIVGNGAGAYPDQEVIKIWADLMGGQVLLQSGPVQEVIGEGPLLMHLGFQLSYDGVGQASPHFVIHQTWMHKTAGRRRQFEDVTDGPAAGADDVIYVEDSDSSQDGSVGVAQASSSRAGGAAEHSVGVASCPLEGPRAALVPTDVKQWVKQEWSLRPRSSDAVWQGVEVFAGVGNLAKAFANIDMPCAVFDKRYDALHQDINSAEGYTRLVGTIAQVATNGLVWFAPQCSTWVWVGRAHTKRTKTEPLGDVSRADVASSNEQAERIAALIHLCHSLRLWYMIEQPTSSSFFSHPDIKRALENTGARSAALQLGRVGAKSVKPLKLVGTAPWLNGVAETVQRRPMLDSPESLVEQKGRWLTGKKAQMVESSAYPMEFCNIIAKAHADYMHHRAGTGHFFKKLF
jgi:hypothetical protein